MIKTQDFTDAQIRTIISDASAPSLGYRLNTHSALTTSIVNDVKILQKSFTSSNSRDTINNMRRVLRSTGVSTDLCDAAVVNILLTLNLSDHAQTVLAS